MTADGSRVNIATGAVNRMPVLKLDGVLDNLTYQQLYDAVVKIAHEGPRAVIVDVSELSVPADRAWSVFTKIRWQVSDSPNVPIALVCADPRGRETIRRTGVTRYVPVYRSVESAVDELPSPSDLFYRQRARTDLPAVPGSVQHGQELATRWLTAWGKSEFVSVACLIAAVLIENALTGSGDELSLRLECDTTTVTVAVESTDVGDPHHESDNTSVLAGFDQIAAMSRSWGRVSSSSGTTVWAVVVPEHEL